MEELKMTKTHDYGFASAAIAEVARMHGTTEEEVLASISEALLEARDAADGENEKLWRTIPAETPEETAAWVINAVAEAILLAAS